MNYILVERKNKCCNDWAYISQYLQRQLLTMGDHYTKRQILQSYTHHKCWILLVMNNIFAYYRCSFSKELRCASGMFQLLIYNFASSSILKLVAVLKRLCWFCARRAQTPFDKPGNFLGQCADQHTELKHLQDKGLCLKTLCLMPIIVTKSLHILLNAFSVSALSHCTKKLQQPLKCGW